MAVEFDDVRFAYPSADKVSLASLEEVAVLDDRGGDEVLHGISFTAEPGQMVALVGSSGAGKSTIASLMARLYDVDSGAVRFGGVDVRDVTFASLKDTVGVVTQDGHLFHESIRSNLTLAAPERRPTKNCGRRCAGPGWPTSSPSMPDGLDTVVGERGYRLSGGQRQRLTIARLLLGRSRVVVLDEATASLDSSSEAAVQQALAAALRAARRSSSPTGCRRACGRPDPRRRGRPHRRRAAPTSSCWPDGGRYAELYETQFGDQERAVA